jgi:hypothetical protein
VGGRARVGQAFPRGCQCLDVLDAHRVLEHRPDELGVSEAVFDQENVQRVHAATT